MHCKIKNTEPQDTHFESIEKIGESTILFRYNLMIKSTNAKIYKIFAFPQWENIKDDPKMKIYVGPTHVLSNTSNNCVKGIINPSTRFLLDTCNVKNGFDGRLKEWRDATWKKIQEHSRNPIIRQTKESSYIYCYGQNITIKQDTSLCPSYVIRIDIQTPFSLANYSHQSNEISLKIKMAMTSSESESIDASHRHLAHVEPRLTETQMLITIWELQNRLKMVQTDLDSSHYNISPTELAGSYWLAGPLIIIASLILTLLKMICFNNPANTTNAPVTYVELYPQVTSAKSPNEPLPPRPV